MNCWTDCCAVFSQGPIKQLCFVPAAYCKCECVLSLAADTEACSSFPSSEDITELLLLLMYFYSGRHPRNEITSHGKNNQNSNTENSAAQNKPWAGLDTQSRFNDFINNAHLTWRWSNNGTTIRGSLTPLLYWLQLWKMFPSMDRLCVCACVCKYPHAHIQHCNLNRILSCFWRFLLDNVTLEGRL